jgi:hypothetical protein
LVVQLRDSEGNIVIVKLDNYKDGSYNYASEIDRFVSHLTGEGGTYEGFEYIEGSGIIKTGPSYWNASGDKLSTSDVEELDYVFQNQQTVRVDNSIQENTVPRELTSYAPITIDLDGDGANGYLGFEAGVEFDFGAGVLATAWVAPEDGLLVFDYDGLLATADGDGIQAIADNIVLTMWAEGAVTDLDALRIYFDTNQDGIFDAEDAHWYSFGVWQDLNSDGLIDTGEFQTLDYYGITGFELSYLDGSEAYSTADNGVDVYGQFNVFYDDGSIGVADDMAFNQTSVTQADAPTESTDTELAVLADGDSETAADDGEPSIGMNEIESNDNSTDIGELVANYLETINSQDLDSQNEYTSAELAYALDELVSDYIESNGIPVDEYASIQEDVLNAIDDDYVNDFNGDVSIDSGLELSADNGSLSPLSSIDVSPIELESNTEIANTTTGDDYIDTGSN